MPAPSNPTEVNIAYLILAHRCPEQLARLIGRLDTPRGRFFVHIDRRADLTPFRNACRDLPAGKMHWVSRVAAPWGGFGLVQAAINGLSAIAAEPTPADFVVLLSGQDYPIQSNPAIASYLHSNLGKSIVTHTPMPVWHWPMWGPTGGMEKIERYWFWFRGWLRVYPPLSPPGSTKERLLNRLFGLRFRLPRRLPAGMHPYAGSQWWCLAWPAVQYVLQFIRQQRQFVNFYRYTRLPDEMFFQTILMNAKDPQIKDNIVNGSLTYADWDRPDPPWPAVFKSEDIDQLATAWGLFARKFDMTVDSQVLDLIDARLIHWTDRGTGR
ncbi:MAG: beta-1,6-N-acetylglucosaminyltransferase [Anaerolineae bacterium]|jgi:hypothetical protein